MHLTLNQENTSVETQKKPRKHRLVCVYLHVQSLKRGNLIIKEKDVCPGSSGSHFENKQMKFLFKSQNHGGDGHRWKIQMRSGTKKPEKIYGWVWAMQVAWASVDMEQKKGVFRVGRATSKPFHNRHLTNRRQGLVTMHSPICEHSKLWTREHSTRKRTCKLKSKSQHIAMSKIMDANTDLSKKGG